MGDVNHNVITVDTLSRFKYDYDQKMSAFLGLKQDKDYATYNDVDRMFGYSVSYNYNNCYSDNNFDWVAEDGSYSNTIYPISGYEMDSFSVTMGGYDVTAQYCSGYSVYIPEVTGDIVINAWANEMEQNFVNIFCSSGIGWEVNPYGPYDTGATINGIFTDALGKPFNVRITMAGNDITSQVYNGGYAFEIPNAHGEINVYVRYIYSMSYELEKDVNISNSPNQILDGESYYAEVYTDYGELRNMSVTMGGSTYYPDDGTGNVSMQSYNRAVINMTITDDTTIHAEYK